ncbi:alkyl hydroperoxide reductase [Nitritalea halalkaliphila LW7]|uniref:Alkyl hydroperoxide reductase n=1 Tax=Nitritalea halalkaliphila LW7 TaxID=1189621 RepID=I5C947_9BACT|nr:TlpA disulfide reductase family protein [Nitritalea halalkaliphila]EIM78349.1 alkyl hydroperoxide reductase [Nitritalea halalkaliphila LW7]
MENAKEKKTHTTTWKTILRDYALMALVFGLLYVTGWITPIMGFVQSGLLATGIKKPKVTLTDRTLEDFDFRGTFTNAAGETVRLADYAGKTLFINVWATWCPPCRAEMPHIDALYTKVASEDLVFLMLSVDQESEKAFRFHEQKGFHFPVLHAGAGLSPSLQSQSIPTTVVVSPEGKIVFYQEGMSNFDTAEFRDFLLGLGPKAALGE